MSIETLLANPAFARLTVATKQPHRIKDDAARALAIKTRNALKGTVAAMVASLRETDTTADVETLNVLRTEFWPRQRAISVAIRANAKSLKVFERALKSPHSHATRDTLAMSILPLYVADALELTSAETIALGYVDALLRNQRLAALLNRCQELSAARGNVPINRAWLHAEKSPLLGSIYNRRFVFRGGRDVISDEYDLADIFQGAMVRAIESGDCDGNNVPFLGSIFRHLQFERAHLTRVSGAEWRGQINARLGIAETESAYPDTDDKHAIRRLGTKSYGTRDTHALALADKAKAEERKRVNEFVAMQARKESIAKVVLSSSEELDGKGFALAIAQLLVDGETIETIVSALGTTRETFLANVKESAAIIPTSSIDHTEEGDNEREYQIALAQEEHAALLRAKRNRAQRADYMRNRHVA